MDPLRGGADDAGRRQAVARLRQLYGEAQELASPTESYANLEWIIGERRNLDQDESAIHRGVAELIVLWLQDLAVALDGRTEAPSAVEADATEVSDDLSRQAVVRNLRVATREFAVAFLGPC